MELGRCGYRLSREQVAALGTSTLADLRARCTATAIEDGFTKVPVSVCCLEEHSDGSVTFPPHVPLQGLNLPAPFENRSAPRVLDDFPAFHGELDESRKQKSACNATLTALRERGAGILSLYTGAGKTTVSISVACTLRVKTLIVVHKEVLLTQWEERIGTFAPGARVGRIQGANIVTEGCHFVIGMLQSLSMRGYDRNVFADFDLVIFDECHHVAAKVFSRALSYLCTPYSLGLSAFVARRDGLTDVINWYLGEVCFLVERKEESGVSVEAVRYDQVVYKEKPPLFKNGQLAICKMIDVLCNDPRRNALILGKVQELAAQGRCILVLSDRRSHCTSLQGALESRGLQAGLFLGGTNRETLNNVAEGCQVIVGTYAIASEGLDIPRLNSLVMATPKSDIRQTVGRITRGSKICHAPLIVDIVDKWGPLIAQSRKRDAFYRSSGFVTSWVRR